jgi:hypothetical protein
VLLTTSEVNYKNETVMNHMDICASYNDYPLMMASLDAETCRE